MNLDGTGEGETTMTRGAAFSVSILLLTAASCGGNTATAPTGPTCSTAQATALTLAVGADTSIDPAADAGCVTFPANASMVDSAEYLIVAQSAAGTFNLSSPFQLRTATVGPVAPLMAQYVSQPAPPRSTAVQFDGFLRRLGRARAFGAARVPPSAGSLRTFAFCSSLDCSIFTKVTARADTVGQHIAVYVDTLAPAGGLNSADIDTLTQIFDSRLYPLDTTTFGGVSDIDTNSVVIVLMTAVVNKLVTKAQCASATGGFVAGFFLPSDLDLTVPIDSSNHGEVFYSIVADPNGTLSCPHSRAQVKRTLPGTFTHEFQHMINFAQHKVMRVGGQAEEGWLDEGLSKYAEELRSEERRVGK